MLMFRAPLQSCAWAGDARPTASITAAAAANRSSDLLTRFACIPPPLNVRERASLLRRYPIAPFPILAFRTAFATAFASGLSMTLEAFLPWQRVARAGGCALPRHRRARPDAGPGLSAL